MKKSLMLLLVALFLCCSISGCDPRVVQCNKCGEFAGVRGGLLPGQGSRCSCGGRIYKVRDLTGDEWQEAKKRGSVILSDGTPVEQVWSPNYNQSRN